jgi:transcriptional regulator with XRE-family HTH domain
MSHANDNKKRRAKPGEARAWLDDVIARKDEIKGCVFWPFSRDQKGYAKINVGGKPDNAHRVVCKAVKGEPPTPSHQAAHNCGNGKFGCISPDCLRWATQIENEADKIIHGTRLMGQDVSNSKITIETARMIHVLRAKGMTQEEIASSLDILRQQVSRIASGDRWAHIHPDNDSVTASMVSDVASNRSTADCRVSISDSQVRQAHVLRALGQTYEEIGKALGMDTKQANRIVRGDRRRNLHPENDPVTARMIAEATSEKVAA